MTENGKPPTLDYATLRGQAGHGRFYPWALVCWTAGVGICSFNLLVILFFAIEMLLLRQNAGGGPEILVGIGLSVVLPIPVGVAACLLLDACRMRHVLLYGMGLHALAWVPLRLVHRATALDPPLLLIYAGSALLAMVLGLLAVHLRCRAARMSQDAWRDREAWS